MDFYDLDFKGVFFKLNSSEKGLTNKEADSRLVQFGKNKLKEGKKISSLQIFLNQFKSFIVWILIVATILSFLIHEVLDASVILLIIILNGVFGWIQEFKAEKSIEALKKMTSLKSVVLRNNRKIEIFSENLVPGDIIFLEEGSKIPADCRILESNSLEVIEGSLTGESVPVSKISDVLKSGLVVNDQKNMLFSSTVVAKGNCKAIVVKTGMDTEIGKIAKMIHDEGEEITPLQKSLDAFGKKLGILTIFIAVIIFIIRLLFNLNKMDFVLNLSESFLISIALAVAAIPEGLPAVVTISLAFGVRRLVKRNSLIRKLSSVETLGSTSVICSDKTGTLTKNEMTVKKIFVDNKIIDVEGTGYSPKGSFLFSGDEFKENSLSLLLKIGMLCNNATLLKDKGSWKVLGDPTEGSLLVSGKKYGLKEEDFNEKRYDEVPFSSETKMMYTLHRKGSRKIAYVKGATEEVLKKCNRYVENGKIKFLTNSIRKKILKQNEDFAKNALRILGFAYKPFTSNSYEKDLIFVGLQAMIDPPREEVKGSISLCKDAGIKVVMITGDYIVTAKAIGKQLGIEGEAISCSDIKFDAKFEKNIEQYGVYARVDPESKLKIVGILKKKGYVVAMTGDGVNDAPALKKADIGVGMGITGTDVAKEASDLVLTDDNFASIVSTVEEGRGIYDNIQKFISYLLSSNFAEILVILFATILGMPLPLTAIQLLWINLVTDGLPAVALGVDPLAKDIMKRKPRPRNERILNRRSLSSILFVGFVISVFVLIIFKLNIGDVVKAQTMAFSSLVVFEIIRLEMIRSDYKLSMFSNKFLILAVFLSFLLQLMVIYTPLNVIFGTVPLGISDWGIIIGSGALLLFLNKAFRFIFRFKSLF